MKIFILSAFFFFLITFLTSCDLLYPPQFYDSIVLKGSNSSSSGSSGLKSWQIVGNRSFSTVSLPPVIKVGSDGNPVVSYFNPPTAYLYCSVLGGGVWNETYTIVGLGSGTFDFDLYGAVPYFSGFDTAGSIMSYNSPSWNILTNVATTSINYPSMDIYGSKLYFAAQVNSGNGVLYDMNLDMTYISTNFDYGGGYNKIIVRSSGGRIFLAYSKSTGTLYIKSGTSSGGAAADVGVSIPSGTGVINFSMTSYNGIAYIIFNRGPTESATYIDSYDGTALNSLGYITNTSGLVMNNPSIAAGNNVIYAGYESGSAMRSNQIFMFNGSSWIQIGTDLAQAYNLSLDVNPSTGQLFIAYQETNSSGPITVQTYK